MSLIFEFANNILAGFYRAAAPHDVSVNGEGRERQFK
jgi:hypothetical protein